MLHLFVELPQTGKGVVFHWCCFMYVVNLARNINVYSIVFYECIKMEISGLVY